MAKASKYRFCAGPWNFSEGRDPYGPETRPAQTFDWKLQALKELGFDAMMFHDDDAVPDIDGKSPAQVLKEAKELKKRLDGEGIEAEMVAPRLWFHPNTIDGAYTSNDKKQRRYAIDRSKQAIDIAGASGRLDFDLARGEAPSDIQIWCIGATGQDERSGVYYSASDQSLKGSLTEAPCRAMP